MVVVVDVVGMEILLKLGNPGNAPAASNTIKQTCVRKRVARLYAGRLHVADSGLPITGLF